MLGCWVSGGGYVKICDGEIMILIRAAKDYNIVSKSGGQLLKIRNQEKVNAFTQAKDGGDVDFSQIEVYVLE